MASTPVHIRSESVSQAQNIVVRPSGVKFQDSGTIEFKNFMSEAATVKFYTLNAKGTASANPITDFCAAGMQGGMFVIPKQNGQPGRKDCKTTKTGDFAYSVEATGHNKLDPVIIIDPYDDLDFGIADLPTSSIAGIVVLLVAVAALAYFFGFGRGKKAS